MVVAAWRRLVQAARWNGQAAQRTTGVASSSEVHCHPVNCQAGTIATEMTGTVRTAATTSRSRREVSSRSAAPWAASSGCSGRTVAA